MKAAESKAKLKRVGPCLYRYVGTGLYYAVAKRAGKIFRRSLETTDQKTAKRKLGDFLRDMERVDPAASRPTLAAFADKFTAARQGRPKTLRRWRDIAARVKRDWPGGSAITVDKVKESQCREWLGGYDFGSPSYNLHLVFLRLMFELAVGDRLISTNPAVSVQKLKLAKPVRTTPTEEQFERILADIRSQKFNPDAAASGDLIEFMGRAGLGQAEAGGLQWQHINWTDSQITVYRLKTKSGFVVPIYPKVRPLLERLRDATVPDPLAHVFAVKDAKKALAAACVRLNLPRYSQRSLRRLFITTALQRGVDVQVIASWQGHRDGGKLILQTYSHVQREHADKMAGLLA